MKKICVVFGGLSCEHDISVITGMQLAKAVEKEFDIEKIYLGLDNKFYLATKIDSLEYFDDKEKINLKEVEFTSHGIYFKNHFHIKLCDIGCVINCCHGGVGENGSLTGMLEVLNIPHCQAPSESAKIAMNKYLTKLMVQDVVPVVKGELISKSDYFDVETIKHEFDEFIVKPNRLGSSIGVQVVDKTEIEEAVLAIFEMGDDALIEEKVNNLVEFNQACFKDKNDLVLSAIERPKTKQDFLTFDDKYNSNSKIKGEDRELPAKIDKELENKICEYTKAVYERLNMNGVARVDYLFNEETKELYFNEINTNPGSMAFYLYEAVGVDYVSLVKRLIENKTENRKLFYYNLGVLKNKLL